MISLMFFPGAAAAPAADAAGAGVCAWAGFSAPAAAPATAAPVAMNFLRLGFLRSITGPPSLDVLYTGIALPGSEILGVGATNPLRRRHAPGDRRTSDVVRDRAEIPVQRLRSHQTRPHK